MPAYTGTVALLIGLLVTVLKAVGVQLPDDFSGQLTQTIVSIIGAASMLIGIWRLLHTKKVADVATAQVIAAGGQPIAGSKSDKVLTESDRLNAAELVRKAASS